MLKQICRDFIKAVGPAFGIVLLFASCLKQNSPYRFFTDEEARCMIAFCEQIIPKDESPGATGAGGMNYIDRQLSEVFHNDRGTYCKGIKKLQSYCLTKFGKAFKALDTNNQVQVLTLLEGNSLKENEWDDARPADFFNLVLAYPMQGFYGSPIHGGNKDYLSFELLRMDYPLVMGQNCYRSS